MQADFFGMDLAQQPDESTTAVFSSDGMYRYLFETRWGDGPIVGFICHNPSTATAERADHSVSRLRNIAQRWGYRGMLLGNRFAGGRSALVADLLDMADPIGPENDSYLELIARRANFLVVAWGDLPCAPERTSAVVEVLLRAGKPLHCLGTTAAGSPKHPAARGRATIPADVQPLLWMPSKAGGEA